MKFSTIFFIAASRFYFNNENHDACLIGLVDPAVTNFSFKVNGTNFKGQVQCFSIQVIINKCFLPNPEKNLAQIHLNDLKNRKKKKHIF